MQTLRDTSVMQIGSDSDVWDRVWHLAPKSAPVRTGLFSAGRRDPAFRKPPQQSLLIRDDAQIADARALPWESFPVATARSDTPMSRHRSRQRVARPAADALSFDLLRTRLLQVLRANDLVTVAATAPSPGCGTTYTATNLALSLARLPSCRTLLIDLNFRAPGVADALGIVPTGGFAHGLLGKIPLTDCLTRFSDNLMVGVADGPHPAPAELLMDPRTSKTLAALKDRLQPDVIVFDLPPMLAYDDATALLPRVDGVLLVTDGTRTVAKQVVRCQEILADQTQLLGVALNKVRREADRDMRYEDV